MQIRCLWPFLSAVCLTLGGCNHLSALSGHPDLNPSLLVSADASRLLNPPPDLQPPSVCNVALNWEANVVSNSGNLVGPIDTTNPPTPNQGQDVYEMYRNKCIYIYINAIDLSFNKFKADLLALIGDFDTGVDLGAFALSTASAAVGGKEAKTILAGIAALLLASKQYMTADVLYNTSIVVILQQMDADRRQAEATILQRMQNGSSATTSGDAGSTPPTKLSTAKVTSGKIIKQNLTVAVPATATAPESQVVINSTRTIPAPPATPAKPGAGSQKTALPYTMDEASSDLLAYYEAGTFAHAIVSMNENAGAQAASCRLTT
jgi:hypothetical protein